MGEKEPPPSQNRLWTRDFTIITVGTVVSMLGSALAWFAMDLMVLDYTGSTLLFAVYGMVYMLPNALAPVLAGPLLDRFSRKKTIYTLDFITAGLFAVLTILLVSGRFSFWLLAAANMLLGAISGVYNVAYDSFFPLLVSEGNYQKAYSVSSTLENLSAVMVPVSALVYKLFGIVPLLIVNTASFLAAAVLETMIRTEESYIALQAEKDGEEKGLRRFTADIREGMKYLLSEKGLLARFIGGVAHYNFKLPVKAKFAIALGVYISVNIFEGVYLFLPVPLMMVMTFLTGMFGITSYNIRLSSTQKYVPDEKKGRFNGAFNTLNTVGALAGQGAAGMLSLVMGERAIVVLANALCLAAAVLIIGGGRREVSEIYNVET